MTAVHASLHADSLRVWLHCIIRHMQPLSERRGSHACVDRRRGRLLHLLVGRQRQHLQPAAAASCGLRTGEQKTPMTTWGWPITPSGPVDHSRICRLQRTWTKEWRARKCPGSARQMMVTCAGTAAYVGPQLSAAAGRVLSSAVSHCANACMSERIAAQGVAPGPC